MKDELSFYRGFFVRFISARGQNSRPGYSPWRAEPCPLAKQGEAIYTLTSSA